MARTLTNATRQLLDKKTGIEPITLIAISWGSFIDPTGQLVFNGDINKYADKDILDDKGNVIIKGTILQMSDLDNTVKLESGSTTASLSITLSDNDGKLKELFDKYDMHKRPVVVYQTFQGLDPTVHPFRNKFQNDGSPYPPDDPFEVFRGEIASPVEWSEGDRTLKFDILSKMYALEAGFAPEQGQFSSVPVDLLGKCWPLCFGTPIHTPATKAEKQLTGTVMSLFGVPDYTLPYKYKLLQFVQQSLINAFNYYRQLINIADDIEIPAYQLQEEYAWHIVSHDAMKQTVEDLHEAIEDINRKIINIVSQYDDPESDSQRADLIAQLKPLQDQRAPLNRQYRQCIVQSENMQKEADGYKLRLKNAKYEITVINKLRKKCRAVLGDYYKCTKQLAQLQTAINNQATLNVSSSAVMVGPEFPQRQVVNFDVNGLRIAGEMDGYSLRNIVPQPSYVNLTVLPRQDDDVSALWLDPAQMQELAQTNSNANGNSNGGGQDWGGTALSMNLVGQYLWLKGNPPDFTQTPPKYDPMDGRIVQVTAQSGNKINVQLVQKQRNPRIQTQSVDYKTNAKIKEAFQATLDRLLTGNETDDQIQALANNIPKELSPRIWNILYGEDNVIYIELVNTTTYNPAVVVDFPPPLIDADKSYFTLIYANEELTDPIKFTDTAAVIRQKILNSTASIDNNDIKVEIVKYWPGNKMWRLLKITYNNLMRPLRIQDKEIVNTGKFDFGNVTLRKVPGVPVGALLTYNRDCLKNKTYKVELYGPLTKFDDDGLPILPVDPPVMRLYFRGYCVEFNPLTTTATQIQNAIKNLDAAFADVKVTSVKKDGKTYTPISDTSLYQGDMLVDFGTEFTSIFLDDGDLFYRISGIEEDPVTHFTDTFLRKIDNKRDLVNPALPPKFTCIVAGGSAHEYTYNERITKLQNMVAKNLNAPGIKKNRNKIRELIQLAKDNPDAAADQGSREALYNAMTAYRTQIKSAGQADFENDDAFKVISDAEYALLYDMEVTGYLEWLNSFDDIDKDFTDDIDYEFTMVGVTGIRETSINIPNYWLKRLEYDPTLSDQDRIFQGQLTLDRIYYETYLLPNSTQAWLANIGDTIKLAGNFQETYVCSLIPGRIKAVYAHKSVGGINRLVPVPSSYYYKIDIDNPDYAGLDSNQVSNCQFVTNNFGYNNFGFYHGATVTLLRPLSELNPEWDDQLYVTIESVVGPNVCDIIFWLIRKYTDLEVDLQSFQHVHAMQVNYPMNFALTSKMNVVQLIEDIAYQARCVLWISEGVAYIRYLPEDPTSIRTITASDIEQGSLTLSYTPTEDLITKYTASWRQTYAQNNDFEITLRRNLTRYNEVADGHEFFCYNIKDLVWKSATWWLMRRASTWKLCSFKLFMNNVDLETQDCITIDLGQMIDPANPKGPLIPNRMISNGPIKAIINKATYNSSDFSVTVDCWLPIVAGTMEIYPYAFPVGLSSVATWPALTDIAGGDAGSPLNMSVPNGVDFTPGGLQPFDMGRPHLDDGNDSLPENPASALSEVDYTEATNEPVVTDFNYTSDLDNSGEEHHVTEDTPEIPKLSEESNKSKGYITTIVNKESRADLLDVNGVLVGTDSDTTGVLYNLLSENGTWQFKAYGINVPSNVTLPKGTYVHVYVDHGKTVFRTLAPVRPAKETDMDGQLLDDPGTMTDETGAVLPDTKSGFF